jgi:hypothetical protein
MYCGTSLKYRKAALCTNLPLCCSTQSTELLFEDLVYVWICWLFLLSQTWRVYISCTLVGCKSFLSTLSASNTPCCVQDGGRIESDSRLWFDSSIFFMCPTPSIVLPSCAQRSCQPSSLSTVSWTMVLTPECSRVHGLSRYCGGVPEASWHRGGMLIGRTRGGTKTTSRG